MERILHHLRLLGAVVVLTWSCALQAQEGCINTYLYDLVNIQGTDQVQVLDCVLPHEYTRFSAVEPGMTYEFTLGGNGYLTVRSGGPDGPVLVQGYSPVQVIPATDDHLFVHYTADSDCNPVQGCQSRTVQWLDWEPYIAQVECGTPLLETYCYGNLEFRSWTYVGTGDVMRLRFLRGTLESGNFDELYIFDGEGPTGPLLFHHSDPASCNLGPVGSAVLSNVQCYHALDVFASSGSIHMILITDFSISCTSTPNYDPFEWEVSCGEFITGQVFLDLDLDCTPTTGDVPVPQVIVKVEPGPVYATSQANGEFHLALDAGSYTITQLNPHVVDHCHPDPQPFQVVAGEPLPVLLFPDTAALPLDLQVTMAEGFARVGFSHLQSVNVRNLSAAISGPVQLVLVHDPILEFVSASLAPDEEQNTTLTWNIPAFMPFEDRTYTISYMVPVDVGLIGTLLTSTASITSAPADAEIGNNAVSRTVMVTAAYDPNDKLATTSTGNTTSWYIPGDEWIDYTIRFQNTGNDTAFTVVITDTLPANLDPGSIQMGAGSHPFTWSLAGQGTLKFNFDNILLPDSNVNEPASHGFVGFRIRPHLPLLPGDEIINIANIYFDYNPPVITEPSVLVAEFGTGMMENKEPQVSIAPNPADQVLQVRSNGASISHIQVRATDGRMVFAPIDVQRGIIDVSALTTGAYLLYVRFVDGSIQHLKFIKS
jgi:hypothetical protein